MFENVIVYTLGRECGTTFLVQFMQFSILDLELDCSELVLSHSIASLVLVVVGHTL